MSVTYGFYNSLNHDRVYDARQVSSIFDGIINDGIYMSIGDKLMVKPLSNMQIIVGTGRAWFNHTWTLNDSPLNLELDPSELILNRIDTVVLEVDEDARENTIKIIKGEPTGSPVPPTLVNNESVHQYPLADISVKKGVTVITQSDITNKVGTSQTPFVTGIIETINIDDLIAKWEAEWEDVSNGKEQEFETWLNTKRIEFQNLINSINADANQSISNNQSAFETWFNSIQAILDNNVAGQLANKIVELENRWKILGKYYEYRDSIDDHNDSAITASDGTTIHGRVVYTVLDS